MRMVLIFSTLKPRWPASASPRARAFNAPTEIGPRIVEGQTKRRGQTDNLPVSRPQAAEGSRKKGAQLRVGREIGGHADHGIGQGIHRDTDEKQRAMAAVTTVAAMRCTQPGDEQGSGESGKSAGRAGR